MHLRPLFIFVILCKVITYKSCVELYINFKKENNKNDMAVFCSDGQAKLAQQLKTTLL